MKENEDLGHLVKVIPKKHRILRIEDAADGSPSYY
jgi:hypothetical protein